MRNAFAHEINEIVIWSHSLQIELLDWEPADLSPNSDGRVIRHVIKRPKNWSILPNDGSTVTGEIFISN